MPLRIGLLLMKVVLICSVIAVILSIIKLGNQESAFLDYSTVPVIEQNKNIPFNVKGKIVYITSDEEEFNQTYRKILSISTLISGLLGIIWIKIGKDWWDF